MRKLVAILLCVAMLGGCRSMRVNAFGVDIGGSATASIDQSAEGISSEEKMGVLLIVGLAIAGVVVAAAASN